MNPRLQELSATSCSPASAGKKILLRRGFLPRLLQALLVALYAGGGVESAVAESLDDPVVTEARQALEDGVPAVAVAKFRQILKDAPALSPEVELLYVESLIRSADPETALQRLRSRRLPASAQADFWQAQALAQLERWEEALPIYERALGGDLPQDLIIPATLGQARALLITGNAPGAVALLEPLVSVPSTTALPAELPLALARAYLEAGDSGKVEPLLKDHLPPDFALNEGPLADELASTAERQISPTGKQALLLLGQAQLAQDQTGRASHTFSAVLRDPTGLSPSEAFLAVTLQADAELRAGNPGNAEEVLLNYLRHNSTSPFLDRAFVRLHAIYTTSSLEPRVALTPFIDQTNSPHLQALARFWLARILVDRESQPDFPAAIALLTDFLDNPSLTDHDLTPVVILELLEFYTATKDTRSQLQLWRTVKDEIDFSAFSPPVLAQIQFRVAVAFYQQEAFEDAAQLFAEAAATDSSLALAALYNESLAWLEENPEAQLFTEFLENRDITATTRLRGPLLLAFAQRMAEVGDFAGALKGLQQLQDEVTDETQLLRAELLRVHVEFVNGDPLRAQQILRKIQPRLERLDDPAMLAEADSLEFWIADSLAGGSSPELQTMAQEFLTSWRDSDLAMPIWFKLGEIYFEEDQFPRAQREFEDLAVAADDPTLSEAARFYAALSAARSMNVRAQERAVELLETVANGGGPLAEDAAIELARLHADLGQLERALEILRPLQGDDRPERIRLEAMQATAQVHFDLGPENPHNLEQAIETAEQLLAMPDLPLELRNFALFLKGRGQQLLNRADEALLTYYEALEKAAAPNAPPEFLWFFRSGFAAAELLEEQGHPESAISILEKLVATGGPRSQEAQQRISLLRLRHFLWEEDAPAP